MATISFLVHSQNSFIEDDGFMIQNPTTILFPSHVPGDFSFTVTAGFFGVSSEKEVYSLRYKLEGPVIGDKRTVVNEVYTLNRPTNDVPPEYQGGLVSFDITNVTFHAEGHYVAEVFLDDEHMGSFPITVIGREKIEKTKVPNIG